MTKKSTGAATPDAAREPNETCFVIMPFGGWFDTYYTDIFCPAIVDAGLLPVRADDLYRAGTIVNDIWQMTKAAKVVLAELTGKNPNVFYELGLAHAAQKPAVLTSESMEDVPFDLRALRVTTYNKNEPHWGEKLRKELTAALTETISSPEGSVLPTFLDVDDRKRLSVPEMQKDLLSLRNDVELLRKSIMIPGSTAFQSLQQRDDKEQWPMYSNSKQTVNKLLSWTSNVAREESAVSKLEALIETLAEKELKK